MGELVHWMNEDITGKKGQQRGEGQRETPTAGLKDKVEGDLDKQSVWNEGQERTHRVDKMDTEGNSQERKTGNWKKMDLWWGLTRVEKIRVLDWG